jgi:hypothetical protein
VTIAFTVLFALGWGALAAFIYRYARYSPWRATRQGITLMSQKVTWLLMVTWCLVAPFVEWPGERWVFLGLLVVIVGLFWATLGGLLAAQRSQRPVARRKGAGYVPHEDIEITQPRRRR